MAACSGGPSKGPSGFNTSSPLGARVGGIRLGEPTVPELSGMTSRLPLHHPLLRSHMAPAMGALSWGSDLRKTNCWRAGEGKPHSLGPVHKEGIYLLTKAQVNFELREWMIIVEVRKMLRWRQRWWLCSWGQHTKRKTFYFMEWFQRD